MRHLNILRTGDATLIVLPKLPSYHAGCGKLRCLWAVDIENHNMFARLIAIKSLLFVGLLISSAHAEKVVLVAGGGTANDHAPANTCKLGTPFGIDFDQGGNAYLVEMTGQRLLKIDPQGQLTAVAGTGEKGHGGNNGPGPQATFNGMHNLAIGPDGIVYLADTWNNCVRTFDPKTGIVAAFAGTGDKGMSGDGGPADQAKFGGIYCATVDVAGNRLLLADLDNRRIRAVDLKTHVVTTVAGNGERGAPKDGAVATASPLVDPRAVTADRHGNIYILERSGHALRVVDKTGKIKTVVGTGKPGYSGDGGPALQATLKGPKHLCMDLNDEVLIADTDNHVVRRYSPATGQITLVAGTGKVGKGAVGAEPKQVELNQPHGVYVSPAGVLYIVDSHNHRVLKIEK